MSLLLNLYKLYTSVWSYVQQEMHRDGGELQGMIGAEFYYARGVMRMNKAARRWGV